MEMENALHPPTQHQTAERKRSGGTGQKRSHREAMEWFFHLLFLLCGTVAVAFVLFISIYLIVSGLPPSGRSA